MTAGFWLPAAGGNHNEVAATDRVLFTGTEDAVGRPGHRGTDVPSESPHASSIRRLAAAGIAQGKSAGLYAPSDPVRRAAMASFPQRRMEVLVANGITAHRRSKRMSGGRRVGYGQRGTLAQIASGFTEG